MRSRTFSRGLQALAAATVIVALSACSNDGSETANTTPTLTGVRSAEPKPTASIAVPPVTTSARATTTTTLPPSEAETTEPASPVEDVDLDGSATLETALAQSGNYTEDQIMSMTVYMAFACDMKDAPELAGMTALIEIPQ